MLDRSIGGRAPSDYLKTLARSAGITPPELDDIIATHAIDPAYLRQDDFSGFFRDREERLLAVISEAMGKEAIREDPLGEGDPAAFEAIDEDLEQPSPALESTRTGSDQAGGPQTFEE